MHFSQSITALPLPDLDESEEKPNRPTLVNQIAFQNLLKISANFQNDDACPRVRSFGELNKLGSE